MSTSTSTLTPSQRSRLIRSTRKVGSLLGETPVLDITSRPSTASLSTSTLSNRSMTHPPTINITIDVAPLASEGPRSPLSPIFANTPGIVSPGLESCEHYTIYMKRRRMAKLARTFGESVPSELVTFGDIPRRSSEKKRRFTIGDMALGLGDTVSKKEKDMYSIHSTESDTVFNIKIEPCSPTASDASSEISFDVIDTSDVPTPTSFSSPSIRQRPASMLVTSPRKASFGHAHTASETATNAKRNSDRDLAFAKLTQTIRGNSSSSSSSKSGFLEVYVDEDTRRKQKGWSGEWNRGDMAEVMNKLRMLK